jgi:hypothetical protein
LLQQALGGEPKEIDAEVVTDEFPKDRDGQPRLELAAMRSALVCIIDHL